MWAFFSECNEILTCILQESVSKAQIEKAGVEDALHRLNESSTSQIQELNKTITELKSANDGEKFYLKDNLSQVSSACNITIKLAVFSMIQTKQYKLNSVYKLNQGTQAVVNISAWGQQVCFMISSSIIKNRTITHLHF